MRLVWVVIPFVFLGIIGISESFAEERTRVLPEEISNARDLCEDTYGKWISDHNECETTGYGNTTEAFESYCKEFNGDYTYCHSSCRNVEGFDEGKMVCGAQCVQVCEFSVPTAKIFSPKKQMAMGVTVFDIVCKEGLELIFKSSDNSPACVKPKTAEKLVERGWTVLDLSNDPSYSKILEKIKIIIDNVTTQSYYYVGDEPSYSKILEIIKSIPEGNAFLLKHESEFTKTNQNFKPTIGVNVDSISIHIGGGYTGETLSVYPLFDDSTVRVTYSCWTDFGGGLIIESNILEVMEKSSCLDELEG